MIEVVLVVVESLLILKFTVFYVNPIYAYNFHFMNEIRVKTKGYLLKIILIIKELLKNN